MGFAYAFRSRIARHYAFLGAFLDVALKANVINFLPLYLSWLGMVLVSPVVCALILIGTATPYAGALSIIMVVRLFDMGSRHAKLIPEKKPCS